MMNKASRQLPVQSSERLAHISTNLIVTNKFIYRKLIMLMLASALVALMMNMSIMSIQSVVAATNNQLERALIDEPATAAAIAANNNDKLTMSTIDMVSPSMGPGQQKLYDSLHDAQTMNENLTGDRVPRHNNNRFDTTVSNKQLPQQAEEQALLTIISNILAAQSNNNNITNAEQLNQLTLGPEESPATEAVSLTSFNDNVLDNGAVDKEVIVDKLLALLDNMETQLMRSLTMKKMLKATYYEHENDKHDNHFWPAQHDIDADFVLNQQLDPRSGLIIGDDESGSIEKRHQDSKEYLRHGINGKLYLPAHRHMQTRQSKSTSTTSKSKPLIAFYFDSFRSNSNSRPKATRIPIESRDWTAKQPRLQSMGGLLGRTSNSIQTRSYTGSNVPDNMGKRIENTRWNKLRGMWGKRSVDNRLAPEEAPDELAKKARSNGDGAALLNRIGSSSDMSRDAVQSHY